ncbi:DUF1202 family protein [Enterobacter sp. ENT03]|uniref:DUF1202 family protein n=1 Tax=Enterobacter sp. ENT03 TaxID=2854780 RepID=UPI001C43C659|nr:DUF1202 family protein [Enterobacter sp. ENT03]MBV7407046.1 DUF1202 domain-containing protein [Enterobacter sp. ENT03]
MSHSWKYGALLFCCASFQAFADTTPPSNDTLKQQFSEQYSGMMRLEKITLRQLDAMGNQATWMAEGDIAATDDLYSIVGMAADYRFYEQTWVKNRPVKFSAMVTSVGTKESGWRTEFFSMQMAARNAGSPMKDKKELDLVVTDSDFNARLNKIESAYADKKAMLDRWEKEKEQLSEKADALHTKIDASWTTQNGKPGNRETVMQEKLAAMRVADQQSDFMTFKDHYQKTVYEPAVAECRKKPDCDILPLMNARDEALAEHGRKHSAQHNAMYQKIQAEMAAGDKKVEPLYKEWQKLQGQIGRLNIEINETQRDYDHWQKDITELRERGVIK